MKPEFQPEFEAILEKLRVNDPSLTYLDLESKKITDADINKLARVLPSNRTLTSLCLSKNQIGAAGAKAFSLALQENHTLTLLSLTNNRMGFGLELTLEAFVNDRTPVKFMYDRNRQLIVQPISMQPQRKVQIPTTVESLTGSVHVLAVTTDTKAPTPIPAIVTPTQLKKAPQAVTPSSSEQPIVTIKVEQTKEVKKESQTKIHQSLLNHVKNNDPTLTSLDLDKNQIADVGAAALRDQLRQAVEDNNLSKVDSLLERWLADLKIADTRAPSSIPAIVTPTQLKKAPQAVTQPSFQQPVVTREGGQTKEVKQEDQIKIDQSLLNHVKNNDTTLSHASEVALPTWVPSAISSSALSLYTDQQKRLIDFLKVTPDFVTRCELAQMPKRQELSYALATDAEKMQQVKEQKSIAQQPLLQGYYFTFQRILNQTFIAALAISS